MSTQTQTSAPDFVAAKARALPTIACTGYIDEVGEMAPTQSGTYAMIKLRLKGTRGARGAFLNFLYRPEWFDLGYDPSTMTSIEDPDDADAGKKMLSVYRRNIAPQSGVSALKGLCGSEDNFRLFLQRRAEAAARVAAERPSDPTFTEEDVAQLLNSFWTEDIPGFELGYILKQGREKTDEVDEKGRPVYQLTERHEIDSWFFPSDEKQVKAQVQRAARSKDGSFIVGFEVD